MVHEPMSSENQRDHLGETFTHLQSILIAYKWIFETFNYKSVLDVGCGEGYGTKILKKKGSIVYAVDIHLPSLASIKDEQINSILSDVFNLGIKSRSIEMIFASHIIEHFDDLERDSFLEEIARVVTSDGLSIFSTPCPEKGYHYQQSGVHKILYDSYNFQRVLKPYFKSVDIMGVYQLQARRRLKNFYKIMKIILRSTGLSSTNTIKKAIGATSIKTTKMNFEVKELSGHPEHLVAICTGAS